MLKVAGSPVQSGGVQFCVEYSSGVQWSPVLCQISDVQGFVNPPRVRGKGQKDKGQGKDFMTLNKPLTLVKGQGFFRGFSGVSFL